MWRRPSAIFESANLTQIAFLARRKYASSLMKTKRVPAQLRYDIQAVSSPIRQDTICETNIIDIVTKGNAQILSAERRGRNFIV